MPPIDFMAILTEAGKPIVLGIFVPFIVYICKSVYAKMPAWGQPVLATAVGPALAWVSNTLGIADVGVQAGALAGLAGIGIRELTNQLITKKVQED